MGVEIIKDRFGEEQFVLSNEDFHNDDVMGDRFSDYQIMKIIKNPNNIFIAKVMSKQNSKIYVLKQLEVNPDMNQMRQEFEMRKNLQHPNIIKYFKYFREGTNKTYMVTEYMNNSGLDSFINAYISMDKPIETNTLWNIFMQCMAGLDYLHNYNIVHGKICPSNILMNENKVIKLDDIKFSFINSTSRGFEAYKSPEYQKGQLDRSADIYAMGKVFKKLITVTKNSQYPLEMRQIVDLMINQYKSQNTSFLYNQIMDQYIKNVAKVSSINAVFRCMSCFQDFSYAMFQNQNRFSEKQTPVAYYYMQCLNNYINNLNPKETIRIYNNVRNLLYQNSQMNNDVEIKPKQILEFILERLNKETGANFRGPSFGIQNMNFDLNKEVALNKSLEYFNRNFDSLISRFFIGHIKTKRICNTCKKGFYSFNIHPFIEFDLDMVQGEPNIEQWFYLQNNKKVLINMEHRITCDNCRLIRDFREFKQFFIVPQCFIISLNRGENYRNTFQPQLSLMLTLDKNKIETRNCPTQFMLVGIVKRVVDNKNEEHFVAIYKDQRQNMWVKSEREKISNIMDPFSDNEGMVLMLFYSAIVQSGNFGQ